MTFCCFFGACQISRANSNFSSEVSNLQFREIDFPSSLDCRSLPFLTHTGPGPFDNALALNVAFEPIDALKKQLELALGKQLEIFRGWNAEGEAHVTVVTPPEYSGVLSKFLKMSDINNIATASKIQEAELTVLGLGSGKKLISGSEEETFFVIVDSSTLRDIRIKIWQAYVRKGGNPKDWDPSWFFPHVTVGFTKQDIHEPDVLKNIRHSFESRFRLSLSPKK